MKTNTTPVRGTRDILPAEQQTREWVKNTILNTYSEFGFSSIKTPILEGIDLLSHSDSGDNTKLMFKVLKRGDKLDIDSAKSSNDLCDIGLRYDLTVPLARFYCKNQNDLPTPFKAIQIDDVFRAERPQKGRLRQFTQCDIDILGDNSLDADIEVIYVSSLTLQKLGFQDFTYKISDRRVLNQLIINCGFNEADCKRVCITLDKFDKVGLTGVKESLISQEFTTEKNVEKLVEAIADIQVNGISCLDKYNISTDVQVSIKTIIDTLKKLSNGKYNVEFDVSIVRGQGYYTSTVSEVYIDGYNGACGGGGRYDNMVGDLTNQSISAVGFSIGFERVCMILQEKNMKITSLKQKIALVYFDENDFVEVINKSNKLKKDYEVITVKRQKNFSNQLKRLSQINVNNFMFIDSDELKSI